MVAWYYLGFLTGGISPRVRKPHTFQFYIVVAR